MDFLVYRKETVRQPKGDTDYFVPNVTDLQPVLTEKDGVKYLVNANILTEDKDCQFQECVLATLWQRGNDPLDINDGIRWAEAALEEITSLQLVADIQEAVQKVSPNFEVTFENVTDSQGRSLMQYNLVAKV